MKKSPAWARNRNTSMTATKGWWQQFLSEIGGSNLVFKAGHAAFSWSVTFLLKEQWWYAGVLDSRADVVKGLMFRKIQHPQDYKGMVNQWIQFNDPNFRDRLQQMLLQQSTRRS